MVHFMDISLIALRNHELAWIQSAVECRKIYHLYPQRSLKNDID